MTLQKKSLIVINVDNVVDVITNSSSELFVLEGQAKEIVGEMISDIYPTYLNEYAELKHISELTNDELDLFMSYHCSPHCWPHKASMLPLIDGFTFDELYEPEKDYFTGEPKPKAWNGEIQYKLRNNLPVDENKSLQWQDTAFVTDDNRERVINGIIKSVGNYFLYSLDENPDWDMQEKLMEIGTRYHLG